MFQTKERRLAERRKREFGKNPYDTGEAERGENRLDEIQIYYRERKEQGIDFQVDETTWNDLEMDAVFLRINHTRSFIGEQVLYNRLKQPKSAQERDDFANEEAWERKLSYFTGKEEKRLKLEEKLTQIGKNREDYYLPMFLLNAGVLEVTHAWIFRVLQFLLFGSLLFGILFDNMICMIIFALVAVTNIVVYAMSKMKYEAYLYALGSVRQLVQFCKKVATRTEWQDLCELDESRMKKIREHVRELDRLTRLIGSFQVKKRGSIAGDAFGILQDYLIGATLWDITVFNRIVQLIDGRQEKLLALYEFAGEIDMAISVASFRASLPGYCMPEFGKYGQRQYSECAQELCKEYEHGQCGWLVGKGIYHPLLENAVKNDFILERGCMITGANASGKSTFIKAVAINAILAQTIHTCMAEQFCMPRMRILTSMAVRDDILSGESYYIREVGYLKRIVEAVDGEMPVLCLIDEILRGTNTAERLAASEAVLDYLAKRKCLAVVATHDMELAEKLAGLYDCYYFQSEIQENDILFDYKIRKGFGQTKNAVKLLAYMKFPREIVELAEKLSSNQKSM